MRRVRVFLVLAIAGVVFVMLACGAERWKTKASLAFYVATRDGRGCANCVPWNHEDHWGKPITAYTGAEPDLVVPGSQIEQVLASRDPSGTGRISFILDDTAALKLMRLSDTGFETGGRILVTTGSLVLGIYGGRELKASHGVLVFSFRDRDRLASAIEMLGIGALDSTSMSDEEAITACLSAVGTDAELRRQCEQLYERDLDADSRALERAERLLESPNPDHDAIAKQLGVD